MNLETAGQRLNELLTERHVGPGSEFRALWGAFRAFALESVDGVAAPGTEADWVEFAAAPTPGRWPGDSPRPATVSVQLARHLFGADGDERIAWVSQRFATTPPPVVDLFGFGGTTEDVPAIGDILPLPRFFAAVEQHPAFAVLDQSGPAIDLETAYERIPGEP